MAKIEKHAPAPHRVLGRCLLNLTSAPWPRKSAQLAPRIKCVLCIHASLLHAQVLDMSVFQGKVAASVRKNLKGPEKS